MRKLLYFIILILSMSAAVTINSTPGEAATSHHELMNEKEVNHTIAIKLKELQTEIKKLNEEKDKLNQKIKEIYPKKKEKLIKQLKDLESNNYSKENQKKLDNIKKQIDTYKEAITINNNLKNERKKLWAKYKKQIKNENLKGAYQTLKLIRQNLQSTISNNKEFLKKLTL